MNERIQALLQQAGMVKILEEHAGEYGNGTLDNTPYPELKKFVELIVAECSNICDQQGRVGWNDDRKAQARLDRDLINNHFRGD